MLIRTRCLSECALIRIWCLSNSGAYHNSMCLYLTAVVIRTRCFSEPGAYQNAVLKIGPNLTAVLIKIRCTYLTAVLIRTRCLSEHDAYQNAVLISMQCSRLLEHYEGAYTIFSPVDVRYLTHTACCSYRLSWCLLLTKY